MQAFVEWRLLCGHRKLDSGQFARESSSFSTLESHAVLMIANDKAIYPSEVDYIVSDQPIRQRRKQQKIGQASKARSIQSILPMGALKQPLMHQFARVTFRRTRATLTFRTKMLYAAHLI